ncbi:MAG: phage holin family protein, partial [Clostridiales bacterium]|nr:phage holin family protein [Clostridiales bacterium]
ADGFVRGLVCFYYIGLEGISILENAAEIGVLIPEKLKDILIQLKDGE